MTLFDRILLSIYALAVAVISLFIMTAYFGLPPVYSTLAVLGLVSRWQVVPVALLFLLFSVRLLLSGFRRERPTRSALTHKSEHGEVRISLNALNNVSQRSSLTVRGVKDARSNVSAVDNKLVVSLRVSASLEDKVPALVKTLQEVVKRDLEASAGIEVAQVRVLVDDISPSSRVRVR